MRGLAGGTGPDEDADSRRALLIFFPDEFSITDCRFRRAGFWAFDTLNGNIMSTAQDYLERTAADVCFLQELRQSAQQCEQAERNAARSHWSLSAEPAADTAAGSTSAGVGVAVRSFFGLSLPRQAMDYELLRTRVLVRWMGAVCRGGLHLVSVYLWTAEGLSQRNLDLLQCLAGVLAGLRGPWIVAGDFNVTPDVLQSSGWPSLVCGVVHAPCTATCNGKVYDYFVASASLSSAVAKVRVVGDGATKPHSAVRLLLKTAPRSHKVRCLAAPRKFGAHLPLGCAPIQPSYDDVMDAALSPNVVLADLDASYARWVSRVENELADVCSLYGDDRRRACGRAQGPRFVWKPALGPVGSPFPRVSVVTNAWRTVDAWLGQLQQGLAAAGRLASSLSHTARRARFRILSTTWNSIGASSEADVFRDWIRRIHGEMLYDRVQVAALRCEAHTAALRGAEADRRHASASWHSWLQEGPSAGLARQHRMSRTAAGWVPSVTAVSRESNSESCDLALEESDDVDVESAEEAALQGNVEVPLDGQQTADEEAAKWAREWQVGQDPPLPLWPATLGLPMPAPCMDLVERQCRSFAVGTGLGWDRLHPRALLRCSQYALKALVRIFIAAELAGKWPQHIGIVIIALLPKPDGGRRPIGLFPSLVRLWMRVRLTVAQAWQTAHERPYFYAGPAKGADVAAWKQAARAELGAALNVDYGVVLLDLVKAFERVPHDWLVRQACRFHYNLYLLRLSLAAYLIPRAVRVGGVYAATVIATRGITAGSALATAELRLLLIEWLDEVAWSCALISLTVYVDDIAIEAVATEALLVECLVAAVRLVVERLQHMRLTFSETKNACTASRPRMGHAIVRALPGLAISYHHRVVSLGSGLGAGVRRNVQPLVKRHTKFVKRRGRFRMLRRAGVRTDRLLRTGGTAALQYGQAVTGVSPALLLRQRRAAAACTVATSGGGDLDITLMLADGGLRGRADPAFAAHTDPIGTWALAVWEAWMPRSALQRLVTAAEQRLARVRRPWSAVCGPGAAFVASSRRLGWTVHNAFEVTLDDGTSLCFNVDSPAFIKRACDDSVRRWRWRAIELRLDSLDSGGAGAGAIVQPLFSLLNPQRSPDAAWGPRQRAGLRSAVANRQWPQARLHRAGLASSPECQFCLELARAAVASPEGHMTHIDIGQLPRGTLAHRIWRCPATEPLRQEYVPQAFRQRALELIDAGSLATAEWLRGLLPLPVTAAPPPPAQETFVWVQRPVDGVFRGVAYTDGSLIDSEVQFCGLCSRLGWAFVVVDDEGDIIASAHGVPPPWVRTIYGAELWAVHMAAMHALPGSAFRTDCYSLVQVFERGRKAATAADSYYARIWNLIFANLDDDDAVDLAWMPAHTQAHDVGNLLLSDGQPLTDIDQRSNAEADRLAKEAAGDTRVPAAARGRIQGAFARAKRLMVWIGHATAAASRWTLPSGATQRDSCPGPRMRQARACGRRSVPAAVQQRPADAGGHWLERRADVWFCVVCRKKSSRWCRIAPEACTGPATERWMVAAGCIAATDAHPRGVSAHQLRVSGDVVWCDRCGAYASERGRDLANRCSRRPKNRSASTRLDALRRGLHPVSGDRLVTESVELPAEADEAVAAAIARGSQRYAALRERVRVREALARGAACG